MSITSGRRRDAAWWRDRLTGPARIGVLAMAIVALSVAGSSAGAVASAGLTLTIAPGDGPAGTSVTVSGSGFRAGEQVVTSYVVNPVTMPPTSVSECSGLAAADGAFRCQASIPLVAGAGGRHGIRATGLASGQSLTSNFNLTKRGALRLSGTPPSPAYLGMPYHFSFTMAGPPGSVVAIVGGRLPTGLTLSPTGTISGTPTTIGTWFGLAATTDRGVDPPAYAQFGIAVTHAPPLRLTGAPPSPLTVGKPYRYDLTVSGGSATPTVAVTSGRLPPGLSLSSDGAIRGTPTTPGTYRVTAAATDGGADPPSVDTFTLVVKLPVLMVVSVGPSPVIETGQGEIHTVVQVSTSPSYGGQTVKISSPQLQARCGGTITFETLQGGSVQVPTTVPNLIPVVLDGDGNVTVVIDGIDCASGTSLVEADLVVAPYLTATTNVVVESPGVTTSGLIGSPANEVETGLGGSDVYAVFSFATDPVYAGQAVEIDSSALLDRCGGVRWESNSLSSPVINSSNAAAIIDSDGNAVFVFKGASCAAGGSLVTATVLAGSFPTYTTTYTVLPPIAILP